ncbi:unnamed protein product (macronuclear) [Paramecium tetraurelia]|uniref:Uncharacterized protein n=1 Tax=Paramecium tetraurelia TaxID=5888 RepID=A0BEC6_PARTE|nr:uncharacterized protein GSPATT00027926001 [Paramecium tetraurelia]CAK56893.1 unnamed protein product [Paramecium tetraurelia]|eukprot:XP_001424291.1 hypothetical protein (macronuclear) [Paramecium tetraurelia strain d4-2]
MMIVWEIKAGKVLYGTPNRDPVNQIQFYNQSDEKLIAVQILEFKILTIDKQIKKVFLQQRFNLQMQTVTILNELSLVYRLIKMINIVIAVKKLAIEKRLAPVKKIFSQRVNCLGLLPNGDVIVGAGDEMGAKVSFQTMLIIQAVNFWKCYVNNIYL